MNLKTKRKHLKDYIKFIQDHLEDEGLKFEQKIEQLDENTPLNFNDHEVLENFSNLLARFKTYEYEDFKTLTLQFKNDINLKLPDELFNKLFDNFKVLRANLKDLKKNKNIKKYYWDLYTKYRLENIKICSQILKELK